MEAPAGAMRIGEMLVNTYRFMRAHPAATLGIGALLASVSASVNGIIVNGVILRDQALTALEEVLNGTASAATMDVLTSDLRSAIPWLIFTVAVSFVTQLAATGVMTLAVLRALRGEPVQPGALWRDVPWTRLLGINALLLGLILLGSLAPLLFAALTGRFVLETMGIVLVVVLVFLVSTSLAVPAAMNERLGPRAAIARSLILVRRAWWRTAAALGVANLLWSAVGNFVGTSLGVVLGALAGGPRSDTAGVLQDLVTSILTGAATLPGLAIMTTLVYFDRVARTTTPGNQ